jgi:hypothetical protein
LIEAGLASPAVNERVAHYSFSIYGTKDTAFSRSGSSVAEPRVVGTKLTFKAESVVKEPGDISLLASEVGLPLQPYSESEFSIDLRALTGVLVQPTPYSDPRSAGLTVQLQYVINDPTRRVDVVRSAPEITVLVYVRVTPDRPLSEFLAALKYFSPSVEPVYIGS